MLKKQLFSGRCTEALFRMVCEARDRERKVLSIVSIALALQAEGFGTEEVVSAFDELVRRDELRGPIRLYAEISDPPPTFI